MMESKAAAGPSPRREEARAPLPGRFTAGVLPTNVVLGANTILTGEHAFKRFLSKRWPALTIGEHCMMDGVHFALGGDARVSLGDYCYFTNAILLCELELRIGSYVVVGWNACIADSDFHPLDPAERVRDAVACSPLSRNRQRPELTRLPVIIEDDVWIGPNVTILKGVRIGAGAFIEAGSLISKDVPPRARMMGNPAVAIGGV